jgi:hypothetical protein
MSEQTRWLDQAEQVFGIEARLEGKSYHYRLAIEPSDYPPRPMVKRETIRGSREVTVYPFESDEAPSLYDLDANRSALSTTGNAVLASLREWLAGISCWRINPVPMGSRAETA